MASDAICKAGVRVVRLATESCHHNVIQVDDERNVCKVQVEKGRESQ